MRKTLESKSLMHRPSPSLKQEKYTVNQARHTLDFLFSRNQHDSALTQARKTYSQGHNCIMGNWRSAVGKKKNDWKSKKYRLDAGMKLDLVNS